MEGRRETRNMEEGKRTFLDFSLEERALVLSAVAQYLNAFFFSSVLKGPTW